MNATTKAKVAGQTVGELLDEMDADKAKRIANVEPLAGGILNVIARAAADPNTDVDKLERLLAMQERVLAREAEMAFNAALLAAQGDIRPIFRNKSNASTNSTYADLEGVSEAVDPIFRNYGFSSSFGTADCPLAGHYRVTCRLSHVDGHSRDYQADVPADTAGIKGTANKTATHGFGSALSYGRRYLKLLIADVATTDDDGRAAGQGETINDEQVRVINGLAEVVDADKRKLCEYLKIEDIAHLPFTRYNDTVNLLTQKNPKAANAFLTGGQ